MRGPPHERDDRGHPGDSEALTAAVRRHPHALDLRGVRRRAGHLGLEDELPVRRTGRRTTRGDQLQDPGAVEARRRRPSRGRPPPPRCTSPRRRDRACRGRSGVVPGPRGPAPPAGARRSRGAAGPTALARPCPRPADASQNGRTGVLRADDRRDRTAAGQRALRERPGRRPRLACTGTRLAPTWQAATSRPSSKRPHISPPSQRGSRLVVAGTVDREHVDDRVLGGERQERVQVGRAQDPHTVAGRQHGASLRPRRGRRKHDQAVSPRAMISGPHDLADDLPLAGRVALVREPRAVLVARSPSSSPGRAPTSTPPDAAAASPAVRDGSTRDHRGDRRPDRGRRRHGIALGVDHDDADAVARPRRADRPPSTAVSTCSSTTSSAATATRSGTSRCGSTTSTVGSGCCGWAWRPTS